jgi:hypothetical protein
MLVLILSNLIALITLQLQSRILLGVDQRLVELRKAQTWMNHFLWTTEICYGHVLARAANELADPEAPAEVAFGGI